MLMGVVFLILTAAGQAGHLLDLAKMNLYLASQHGHGGWWNTTSSHMSRSLCWETAGKDMPKSEVAQATSMIRPNHDLKAA